MQDRGSGYLARPAPSGLADVIEIVLDKGIVIDAELHVSALGIQLLSIDARITVTSVDTYLRFAEATNRLDISDQVPSPVDVLIEGTEKVVQKVAADVVEQKIEHVVEKVQDTVQEKVPEKVKETVEKVEEKVEETREKVADTARALAVGAVEKTVELVEEVLPAVNGATDGDEDSVKERG